MTIKELEDYLERGKTIFFGKGEGNIMRLKLDKDYFSIQDNKLYDRLGRFWFNIEELYNEEDYKFLNKYGNITRTDTLSMPLERDATKGNIFPFIDKIGRRLMFCYDVVKKVYIIKDVCADNILCETTNYLELCEFCRKLFR